ncbi:MAG: hypothetical protein AAF909_10740 [Pseudomonadota bacterium]
MTDQRLRTRQSLQLSLRSAFAVALIATPALFGGGGFLLFVLFRFIGGDETGLAELFMWISLIIAFSAPFGALTYLTVGAWRFWRAAKRGETEPKHYAWQGFIANFIGAGSSTLLASPLLIFFAGSGVVGAVAICVLVHAFGLVFAPLYGLVFGWILTRITHDLSARDSMLEQAEAVFR